MQLKQLELAGGGTLTVYLRDCCERMPNVLDRPLVLVVPGGGYTHVSAREGDPVALQFAAAGYPPARTPAVPPGRRCPPAAQSCRGGHTALP